MDIQPQTLTFQVPIQDPANRALTLHNTSSHRLAYKIKTTAPKLYCVRPNASIVEPGQQIQVQIMRQLKDQPSPNERTKDKFLVLSHPIDDNVNSSSDMSELWSKFENDRAELKSKKIRVEYDFSADGAAAHEKTTAAAVSPTSAGDTTLADTTLMSAKEDESTLPTVVSDAKAASKQAEKDISSTTDKLRSSASSKLGTAKSSTSEPGFPANASVASSPAKNQTFLGLPLSAIIVLVFAILLGAWWKYF